MKFVKILSLAGLIGLSSAMTGCSDDFLEITPGSNYTGESFYTSDKAVLKAGEPLYNRAWFNFNSKGMLYIGSYRANDGWAPYNDKGAFAQFKTTPLSEGLVESWSSLYLVVTMSNSIIYDLSHNCGNEVSAEARNRVLGEAYLMRGIAYFYMVRTWGPSILFEDNTKVISAPQRPLNPEEDVLKFVIRDLRKAAELLPPTGANGRVSSYGAKAMLAKALLAHSGWNKVERDQNELNECIALCEDVIDNSGNALMDNFEDLFRYQYNNNCETLIAMQWADPLLAEWGEGNYLNTDLAFSDVCDVRCWGGTVQPSMDIVDYFNNGHFGQKRWIATFFSEGNYYPYIKSQHGGFYYTKKSLTCKKGVVGSLEDNDGKLAYRFSPLNTYVLRLADVYLTHAEASLGNKAELTSGRGLESFNTIRRRAEVAELESIDFRTIVRERRIEFCMEYSNWFDMVSWYRWKPQEMLKFFNEEQHRAYRITPNKVIKINMPDGSFKLNYDVEYKSMYRLLDNGEDNPKFDLAKITNHDDVILSETTIFLPYPEVDVLQNPYLSKEPQPYDFGE